MGRWSCFSGNVISFQISGRAGINVDCSYTIQWRHSNFGNTFGHINIAYWYDRGLLSGPAVRVAGYRSRCSRFDSLHYQIFWVVSMERGPLSLVTTIEELLGRKSIGWGLENQEYSRSDPVVLATQNPLSAKRWH
jgi:hypothetical protein